MYSCTTTLVALQLRLVERKKEKERQKDRNETKRLFSGPISSGKKQSLQVCSFFFFFFFFFNFCWLFSDKSEREREKENKNQLEEDTGGRSGWVVGALCIKSIFGTLSSEDVKNQIKSNRENESEIKQRNKETKKPKREKQTS